ncbi:glycosyltransferase involved in cell wall biosynthesis [Evansella vedderi]|uniref:Glycosyltransferase involved in cell wall biosynthesis n=1 Tax=Evansella vedderi TaxID=38282 RepID=A0ABT9ZPI2_9BACI|nr:glycosyltransferase family 1 protein [Evansella vedderi]MDQ0253158.1 glycosyltransferase involved in cell wall biosynthesis [Evansella vedderi]
MLQLEPIRILQVVTIMNRGGLETMLMNYYRQIDRTKIQFDFMVHREEEGHYDDEILDLGGNIYRMPPIRPGNYNVYFKELKEFFELYSDYNIVHAHINENSAFVLRAAKEANIPCRIAHSHLAGLPLDYKLPFRIYARMHLNQNANNFFACSDEAGEWLFGKKLLQKEKLVVFKNAVNCNEFKYNEITRERVRKELNIEGNFVVGHVGRFNPQKNHSFLIDTFHEIYKQNNKAILLLVGQGDLLNNIKKKVERLGLTDVVKFLGLRSDIADLMQGMDLFLFPSLYEGLGVVLIEAQAAGLKSITSTGTPKEADVTNTVEFYNLNMSPKEWANKILQIDYSRYEKTESIIENGYDVSTNLKWLTKFYLENNKLKEVVPR